MEQWEEKNEKVLSLMRNLKSEKVDILSVLIVLIVNWDGRNDNISNINIRCGDVFSIKSQFGGED
jgi:hypothetical protein